MRVFDRKLLHKNHKFIPLQASIHAVLVDIVERFSRGFSKMWAYNKVRHGAALMRTISTCWAH